MRQFFYTPLILVLAITGLQAQIVPAVNARLNYNQVMIEHPPVHGAEVYVIELSDSADVSFKHPVIELRDSFPASIISNLGFGKNYHWRYAAVIRGKRAAWSASYSFGVKPDPFHINKEKRLRVIINDSARNAGGLVAVDILHGIFDRDGNMVWFFPDLKNGPRKGAGTDDLFLNKAGTLTTLGGQNGVEYDLNGKQLWMTPFKMPNRILAPLGDYYNHDLKRLPNGHYMVIAQDFAWKKIPPKYSINKLLSYTDSSRHRWGVLTSGIKTLTLPGGYILKFDSTGTYMYMNMSELVEYSKKDNAVWNWKAENYIKDIDIFPNGGEMEPEAVRQEPHLNGFCLDPSGENVYISFKNFGRIIKIDKKSGTVLYSWGKKMPSGEAKDGENFFRHQHAPVILSNGNLALFNNADMRARNEPSSVRVISMPSPGHPSKIVWQYDCRFDSLMRRNKSARGGNVEEMSNGNFLVCEGGINRIFEITQNKDIVWHAMVERNTHNDSGWVAYPLYRSHYTSSLYPCYFTIETDADSVLSRKTSIHLKIYNAGTDTDSYNIKVTSSSNNYRINQNSALVPGRHSAEITLTPSGTPVAGEKILILVASDNNPDNQRKASLAYK